MYSCINFFVSNIKFYFVFTRELIHPFTNSYKKFIYYHFYWSINLYNCKMVSVHALILSKSLYSKGRNFFITLKIIRSGIWGRLDPKPLSFTNKSKSYKKKLLGCMWSIYVSKEKINMLLLMGAPHFDNFWGGGKSRDVSRKFDTPWPVQ